MGWKIEILNRLIAFVFFVSVVIQPLCDSIPAAGEHNFRKELTEDGQFVGE